MATENTTYWAKKSDRARAIEPLILARQINEDWLKSSVTVTHYQFVGALREALMDLLDSSAGNSRAGTNLPTSSLRLMLQICLQDVLSVDRHLGCKAGNRNAEGSNAIRALGPLEEGGEQTIARIVREWAMSTLEPWSMDKGCTANALRVKGAALGSNIVSSVSNLTLRDPRSGKLNFPLVARLLADQLRGQTLFEGLGPCELVLPGPFDESSFDLISAPRTLAAGASGTHTFSMIARVQVSTMPCSDAAYVSVTPSKRVWASTMPKGANTGSKATAYAFPPQADGSDALHAIVPLTVERKPAEQGYSWELNGDEYAVVKEQARLLQQEAPDTLAIGIAESAQDKNRWWIGLPQTTRLYRSLNQHTPSDTDEVELMQRCCELLEGFADGPIDFELRSLPLNKSSTTAMVKAEDCGTLGAALLEADPDAQEDDDEEPADSAGSQNEVKLAAFREQCIRVLAKVYPGARPTLWLLGGTPEEVLIAEQIARHLFGDSVTFKRDPLPDQVHGLRADLPGAELPSKQRFNLRVEKWKDAQNPGGLLNAIAAHEGPKFVLVCADKDLGYKQEDVVNRRAAIHAICSHTRAGVHHVLPMEPANTPARLARARQNFIHRMQSAMTDVMLAHSGHVINVAEFARDRIPSGCKAIYGIQALRKNAQKYSGETRVSMLVYSRINLSNETTEVQYHYGSGARIHYSNWMPLSEGLIWLASQRTITSDDRWLAANFETQTRKFLIETQESDPQAVVLIDWGTLPGLWKNLTDDNLRSAPALGNLLLKQAFSQMSFVRIRYGIDAKISIRGKSTTFYEAIRYEAASKVLTGNVYRDEYATTTKRLVEITAGATAAAGSYRASHFIGMMTPRKTSQGKRGLSSFRSVSLMNRVGKGQDLNDAKDAIFEIALRAALSKDNSSPGPIDISVLQHPDNISAQNLAVLCMGLRLGYPHYDEWTQLPAPLFFIRKIDDYIIKYPSDAEPEQTALADGLDSPSDGAPLTESGSGSDEVMTGTPAFELVSQMVQHDLKFEAETPAAEQEAADTDLDPERVLAPVATVEAAPNLSSALDADGKLNADLLLQLAKNVKYQSLVPFDVADGMRKRRFFNGMMRGDISVTVEVPYFVNLSQIFSSYPKLDRANINRAWRQLRENGCVRQVAQAPYSDFSGWLAKKMMHPQGAYIVNARDLFGKAYILPQLDALVLQYNAQSLERGESIYLVDGLVDLSPIVNEACAQLDDETLGWLVFSAAQCPTFGIGPSILGSLTCAPGPRTKAALAYYVQCAQALQLGLAQISASLNSSSGHFQSIHLKRPVEFATPPASELTNMAKAVQATMALMPLMPAGLPRAEDPRPVAAVELPVTTVSIAAPCALNEPTVTEITATDITDPVMKIKSEISQLLLRLEPGQDNFAPEVEMIRALLVDLERIDSVRKVDAMRATEVLQLCNQASTKAQELLDRIAAIDHENLFQAGTYRPTIITPDLLEAVQKELASIEENVRTAEKTNESLQERLAAVVPESDKRRNARLISALDIELEGQLEAIQTQIAENGCYTIVRTDDPDDGLKAKTAETPTADALVPSSAETPSTDHAIDPTVPAAAQEPVVPITTPVAAQLAECMLPAPEESLHHSEATAALLPPLPTETSYCEAIEVIHVLSDTPEALEPQTPVALDQESDQDDPAEVMPAVNADTLAKILQTPEAIPVHAFAPSTSMKEILQEATAGENKGLDRALFNLRSLMDKRHFGLASVYTDAIESTFGPQKDIGLNYALLQALALELEAVDCNSMVQSKFNNWQTQVFDEIDSAEGIPQAVAMLGAGLSSAIFYDPNHTSSDPLWAVLGPVQSTLQDQSSLTALIEHVATREKTAVTLTQNKLILSFASSEDRITAQLATYRERAAKWRGDASMHTKWSHMGFLRAHDYIYSTETAVGRCLSLVAKDDVKALKQAMKDCHGKFRKPKATIEEAFRKIRDHTEINGSYLVYAVSNLEATESFLQEYIALSERKIDSGKGHALLQHEREYIKTLHARLKDAIVEIDEIMASGKTWTTLESICLQSGRDLMQAVIRLFDDSKADASIPQDIQRLLIQQPMGADLMPSMKANPAYNQRALLQGDALIDSINALLKDELCELPHPISKESLDRLLQSAQNTHIANNRFLPAWRIETLLMRPKTRATIADQQPSLLNQYSRASTELLRKLQEIRQRVTHAMALSALTQKDASNMLYTVSSVEAVLKQGSLGKPECRSPSYPDFPHAYFHINESITRVLDSRMQEATERLQALLQDLRELKGSEIHKDADRIERMLTTKKPADLRAAHDAIRLLDSDQKLPTSSPQRTQETPKQFEDLVEAVGKVMSPKEGMLESLIGLLKKPVLSAVHAFIAHLDADQRSEAATFIENWIELCKARGGDAAEKASAMFAALGLGIPRFAPESTSRGLTVRLEFPPNPFASLSSDCFIPPQLGSQQSCLPVYAITGMRPDNEIATIIHDLTNNPVVIMARTTLTLNKRMKTVSRGASVILIEDYLIAFMAINPVTRAQKMLEIGLLNFQTNPYSAEGAHVAREMFFGRQAELSALRSVKNAAILYGGRRLGESSLLAQIERDENRPQSGRRALYIPMNKDYSGNDHVLFAWKSIYEHLVTHQIISQMSMPTDSAQAYADWIESGLVSGPTTHCYLLLDEADDLMAAELELAHGRPGFIRSLQNVSESLAARGFTLRYCIAGLHNLARMTTEVNSALGKAETIALEPFTSAEDIMRGIELITKPMAALGFYFHSESGDLPLRIMSVCNFYPAFIQIYCRKLLSYMHNKRAGGDAYCFITLDDIERVESDHDLLADLSKKFSMTLDLDTRYKAIALVLADIYYTEIENGADDGATMQEIRERCDVYVSTHFKNINTSAFESLLDEMRKLNVLEKSSNKYRLRNPSIAMLLGDKDRVMSQIEDLAQLQPSRSINHGEKRIHLQANANSRATSEPLPNFPMPISWIHSQIGGKRTLDGSLPILCGNGQSGLRQISPPKFAAKLTQTDDFYCNPVSFAEMSAFVRTKTCTGLIPASGNLLLMSASTAWKTSEIGSFSNLAARIVTNRIQMVLSALPPRIWEMVCHLKEQKKKGITSSLDKWNIVPVPPYSIDAIQFHLGDNRAVADSKQACDDILYATCGFARLVQKHCNESMTVEKAANLRKDAEKAFPSLASFYDDIAMPREAIPQAHLRHMEAGLLLIHGEARIDTSLEYINELLHENFTDQPDLDKFDLLFLQLLGLLQEGPDSKWHVPYLYQNLINSHSKEEQC
jgi:hypothetical protein